MAALILFGGLIAFYVCGLPLTYWAYRRQRVAQRGDVLFGASPLIGMAAVSAVTRLLLAAGIPVKYSAWPVLVTGFLATGWIIWRERAKLASEARRLTNWLVYLAAPLGSTLAIGFPYLRSDPEFWHGYDWWDVVFYGTQAELVKEHALSQVSTLAQSQPWAMVSMHFWQGQHRIGRAVVEAFAATVTGLPGDAATGLVIIGSVWMSYGVMRFLSAETRIGEPYRTLGSLAVAIAPTVLLAGMEGFLPSVYSFLLIAVLCRLLVDMMVARSWWLVGLTSLVISMMILVLMENIWVALALGVAAALFLVITRSAAIISWAYLVVAFGASALLAAPYLPELRNEVQVVDSARTALNTIYPFGNSPQVFTWLLWGTTSESAPSIGKYLTLLALGVVILGSFGLLLTVWREINAVAFLMFCVATSPLLMVLGDQDNRYAFVKNLHFAFPMLIFGFCLLLGSVADRIRGEKSVGRRRRLITDAVCIAILAAFLVGMGRRTVHLMSYSLTGEKIAYAQTDAIRYAFSPADLAAYRDYRTRAGQDILFVSPGNSSLRYWWSSYFLRNNQVHNLSPIQGSLFVDDRQPSYADLAQIPITTEVIYSPDYQDLSISPADRVDVACLVAGRNAQTTTLYTEDYALPNITALTVNCFARRAVVVRFSLTIDPTAGPVRVTGDGVSGELSATSKDVQLSFAPGAHSVELTLSGATTINRVSAAVLASN